MSLRIGSLNLSSLDIRILYCDTIAAHHETAALIQALEFEVRLLDLECPWKVIELVNNLK